MDLNPGLVKLERCCKRLTERFCAFLHSLIYPIVTQKAFQAFSCYIFDEGTPDSTSWLRADVSIECGTGSHAQAQVLGFVAILLYPVGLLLFFGVLLYISRDEIQSGRQATQLSKSVAFLYREYETGWYGWGETRLEIQTIMLHPQQPTHTRGVP